MTFSNLNLNSQFQNLTLLKGIHLIYTYPQKIEEKKMFEKVTPHLSHFTNKLIKLNESL